MEYTDAEMEEALNETAEALNWPERELTEREKKIVDDAWKAYSSLPAPGLMLPAHAGDEPPTALERKFGEEDQAAALLRLAKEYFPEAPVDHVAEFERLAKEFQPEA